MKNFSLFGGNRSWILLISAILFYSACKKDHPSPPTTGNGDSTAVQRLSDEDSLKFYVWWMNESDSANIPLYYWFDQVPTLDPFSAMFANADSLLRGSNGIASYPVVNGQKVDRYSFLDRAGSVSGELEEGVSGDFGFDVAAVSEQSGEVSLYVIYVYAESPSGKAGVRRGWKISAIKGVPDMNLNDPSSVNQISDAIYSDPTTEFTFAKEDGSDTTVTLDRTSYHINPVLLDTVYMVSNKKVGYLVYNSFINVGSDGNGVQAKKEIDDAFAKFKTAGIQDLVVDLRYNGGGSVATVDYLDNLIAPAAANGQTMYTYDYNQPLTDFFNSDPELKAANIDPIKFDLNPANLNLSRVFFIVGSGTASASELTINNLKPYMQVKLIGETTYGKPVGFFGFPIEFVTANNGYQHVADLYAINFKTMNAANQGDYYSGMTPDDAYAYFNGYDWGDTRDVRLHDALNFIETGSFKASAQGRRAPQEQYLREMPGSPLRNPNVFNGMVDFRMKNEFPLKKK